MSCELTIKVKDSFRTMTRKAIIVQAIQASLGDPTVEALVDEAVKQFGETVTKISVSIKLLDT